MLWEAEAPGKVDKVAMAVQAVTAGWGVGQAPPEKPGKGRAAPQKEGMEVPDRQATKAVEQLAMRAGLVQEKAAKLGPESPDSPAMQARGVQRARAARRVAAGPCPEILDNLGMQAPEECRREAREESRGVVRLRGATVGAAGRRSARYRRQIATEIRATGAKPT